MAIATAVTVEHNVEQKPANVVQTQVVDTRAEENDVTDEETARNLKKRTIQIGLAVLIILNVLMFFAGITTTNECPIQPMIPIYLAVAGAGGILIKGIPIANRNRRMVLLNRIAYVLLIFEFIWMIVGSYWIYSIYRPSYRPEDGWYCNKTVYLIAFWLLTIHYIVLALILLIPFCIASWFMCYVLIDSTLKM